MTERDLKILKDHPVPAPSADAKAAAIAAALAAYDAASASGDANEKNALPPKGDDEPARPTHMILLKPWRPMMRLQSSHYAIAASIAAAFVAVPISIHYLNLNRDALRSPDKPAKSTADAPASGRTERDGAKVAEELEKKDANGERRKIADLRTAEPKPADKAKAPAEAVPGASAPATVAAPVPAMPEQQFGFTGGARIGNELSRSAAPAMDRLTGVTGRLDQTYVPHVEVGRDRFEHVSENPVKQVASEPVSTFSIDVDTASYGFVRRALNAGHVPPADAVRVEELMNYFNYDYARPETAEPPFQPTVTVLPSLWNAEHKLIHIAIKGYELKSAERPRANLVFLIDVSGSMQPADRLPLVKNSLKLLLDNLKPDDTVGIVTYASGSGVALEPTKVSDKGKIIAAIEALGAGGSTAGAQGIEDAYRLIESNFDKTAVNRVILATDGDFNVGVSDHNQLKSMIERKRDSGIFLSILGVGQGNYNDQLMQTLAQNGNGTAAYIDTLNEARKVLVEEASSTLFPIAKDVKIQVEFNPAEVAEYRLVGYETRALRREDFNNDKIDAGDVGSGHAVTAIYDITPVGAKKLVDELRYGAPAAMDAKPAPAATAKPGELGFLKLRYKLPKEDKSRLIEVPIRTADMLPSIDKASADVRFSTAVASFGQMLKGGNWTGSLSYDDIIALASKAKGDDAFGLRAEFVNLVRLAKSAK